MWLAIIAHMRRLFLIVLLVLLPLRGWAANAMTLELLPVHPGGAAHALCADHVTPAAHGAAVAHGDRHGVPGGDAAVHDASHTHPHCTACQLPALTWPVWPTLAAAPPQSTPEAHAAVLRNPAPRRLIKPPIA